MKRIILIALTLLMCSCTRVIHETEYIPQLMQPVAANSVDADMARNYCREDCVSFDVTGIKDIIYDPEYDYSYIEYTDSVISNEDSRRYEFFPFAVIYVENELVAIIKDIVNDNIDYNVANEIIASIADFKCCTELDLYYLKFNKESREYIRNHGTLNGFKSFNL